MSSEAGRISRVTGFTLIELLVVLAIAAAVGAITAPDLWSSYLRASERLIVIDYGRDLTEVRRELMNSRRSMSLRANELGRSRAGLPALVTGWSIASNSQIELLATGATNGGNIDFTSPTGRHWRLTLGVLDGNIAVELL